MPGPRQYRGRMASGNRTYDFHTGFRPLLRLRPRKPRSIATNSLRSSSSKYPWGVGGFSLTGRGSEVVGVADCERTSCSPGRVAGPTITPAVILEIGLLGAEVAGFVLGAEVAPLLSNAWRPQLLSPFTHLHRYSLQEEHCLFVAEGVLHTMHVCSTPPRRGRSVAAGSSMGRREANREWEVDGWERGGNGVAVGTCEKSRE